MGTATSALVARQPPRGRPRSPARRAKILETAAGILAEAGFAALTIEAIAERSGIAKATIYRWWPNRSAVALECVAERMAPISDRPEIGDMRERFRRQLRETARLLSGPQGHVIAALIGAKQTDPVLAEAYAERIAKPRRAVVRQMLNEAIERGELAPHVDADTFIDALYAPLYYRRLVSGEPLTNAFVDSVVDLVFSTSRPPA